MKKWDVIGLRFALNALPILLRQQNFRIEIILALLAIGLGFYLQINAHEWLWIGLAITLVLVGEAINTAIELTLDRIGRDYHLTTKQAKDVAQEQLFYVVFMPLLMGL